MYLFPLWQGGIVDKTPENLFKDDSYFFYAFVLWMCAA